MDVDERLDNSGTQGGQVLQEAVISEGDFITSSNSVSATLAMQASRPQ